MDQIRPRKPSASVRMNGRAGAVVKLLKEVGRVRKYDDLMELFAPRTGWKRSVPLPRKWPKSVAKPFLQNVPNGGTFCFSAGSGLAPSFWCLVRRRCKFGRGKIGDDVAFLRFTLDLHAGGRGLVHNRSCCGRSNRP